MCTLTEQLKEIKLDRKTIEKALKFSNVVSTIDDLPPASSQVHGDCIYVKSENSTYMNVNSHHWIPMYSDKTKDKIESHNMPQICSRCGAPLKMHLHTCEYCGTSYR